MLKKQLPHITCCLTAHDVQQALLASTGKDLNVTFLSDRSAVEHIVARQGSVLVLAEIVDSLGSRLSSLLVRHWRDTLGVPVVAVVRAIPAEVRLIAEAVRSGVDEIFIVGIDDIGLRIRQLLHEREAASARTLREILMGAVDADTMDLIETSLHELGQVSAHGLARSAGVSERTLTRRFALLGLPAPGTILRWVRTLLAIQDLRDHHHSVTHAARHYGYSSNTAFRSTLRQLTGMSPSEAREPQGYSRALTAFHSVLKQTRRDRPALVSVRAS